MPRQLRFTKSDNLLQDVKFLSSAPPQPVAFKSDDELLLMARQIFWDREEENFDGLQAEERPLPRRIQKRTWQAYWHRRVRLTGSASVFARKCRDHRLGRLDRELLAYLMLVDLGLINAGRPNCRSIVRQVAISPAEHLRGVRRLSDSGRLYQAGLIDFDDLSTTPTSRQPTVDADLLAAMLNCEANLEVEWKCDTQEQLLTHVEELCRAFLTKAQSLQSSNRRRFFAPHPTPAFREAGQLMRQFEAALAPHSEWPLHRLLEARLNLEERMVVVVLIGKHLGCDLGEPLIFKGKGLARVAATDVRQGQGNSAVMQPASSLLQENWITTATGEENPLLQNAAAWKQAEFELSSRSIEQLGLAPVRAIVGSGSTEISRPHIGMADLVLTPRVRQSLELAITHVRKNQVLLSNWGLRRIAPYGNAPVLLFSGPPGTGKTATAEALAGELEKPFLPVDYAALNSMWHGETEKHIAEVFEKARDSGGVLFFDEADAALAERQSSMRRWEVQQINVLLQQIERHSEVCILATNRKSVLDPALQRRISISIEFTRPNKSQRRELLKKLIPAEMPVAEDVDLEELSAGDYSGGAIKNIVLNAARFALSRSGDARVSMDDFRRAIRLESEGCFHDPRRNPLGFHVACLDDDSLLSQMPSAHRTEPRSDNSHVSP